MILFPFCNDAAVRARQRIEKTIIQVFTFHLTPLGFQMVGFPVESIPCGSSFAFAPDNQSNMVIIAKRTCISRYDYTTLTFLTVNLFITELGGHLRHQPEWFRQLMPKSKKGI